MKVDIDAETGWEQHNFLLVQSLIKRNYYYGTRRLNGSVQCQLPIIMADEGEIRINLEVNHSWATFHDDNKISKGVKIRGKDHVAQSLEDSKAAPWNQFTCCVL